MKRLTTWIIAALCCGATAAGALQEDTELEWYGYFKLDMARDSAVSSNGNYILYVKPHEDDRAVSTLNMTARQTRFGAKIKRESLNGVLEFDFYGSSPENKNALMLRKAYVVVPLGSLFLEAGQTSDLISPLVSSTINYSAGWGAGNVGYRRPQIKIYQRAGALYWGLSLARNIGGDIDGDGIDDGEASGLPGIQGRVACSIDLGGSNLNVGTSAHYGRCDCPDENKSYANWSINGDLSWVLSESVSLLGEVYRGVNMGQYGGAIYNKSQVGGVHSSGGWINALYKPSVLWRFAVGGGADQVDKNDLRGVESARQRNAVIFANGQRRIAAGLWAGFELSNWTTRYANVTPGTESEPTDWRSA